MRQRLLSRLGAVGAIAVVMGLVGIANAEAGCRRCAPPGWGAERTVVHYGYYPRYRHVYLVDYTTDPYAYRYEPRGYYPYYNSGYWAPAAEIRKRRRVYYEIKHPPYYQAWGYPRAGYRHRAWHARHHGHIRRGHW